MKMNRGPSVAGPSSSVGIARFFDTDTSGPKLSPEFVLGISVAFVILMFVLKAFALF